MSEQIDNNKLYRVLTFDMLKTSADDVSKAITKAMEEGYGPSQHAWSPDGRFLIYTMVNSTEATKLLVEGLTGAVGGGGLGFGGGGSRFGLS